MAKVNKKKKELGLGIRALLQGLDEPDTGDNSSSVSGVLNSINEISVEDIEENPFQPRVDFEEEHLQELMESIKVHGVVQPITVRALSGGKYQLISGERRWRASKLAGKESIPAYIRAADDQEMLEIALIENIQRRDLNHLEVALSYQRLLDECGLKHEELGDRVGKSRSQVTNYLRLLKLSPDIQDALRKRTISMGHARCLSGLEKQEQQIYLFQETVKKGLSVRQVEALAKQMKSSSSQKLAKSKAPKKLPLAYQRLQDKLASRFETKIDINRNNKGAGLIAINFSNDDDLNRILDLLDV